jgi:hypothetical protein
MFRRWTTIVLLIALLATSWTLSACSSRNAEESEAAVVEVSLAEPESMPAEVQETPQRVQEAYRFAAANPDLVKQIPCYCGCGPMGHDSNYACFWQKDGAVETHAMGCGICVDIAQDTLRGLRKGQSLESIRAQIDADYSRFGPSTDTPPIQIEKIDWSTGSSTTSESACTNTPLGVAVAEGSQATGSACSSQ